jgi:hypothetical protein
MAVDTTTFLENFKVIYGALQDQVSTEAAIMNLFGDGSKFGKPITDQIGAKGYTFGCRLRPNFNMGFRLEGTTGVGTAGNQTIKQGTVYLKYFYVPMVITGQAENLSKGEGKAFLQSKALEAKFDTKDAVAHANVVVAGAERGGQLAQVAAAPAPGAGSFTCDTAGGLPGAIYLRVGMPIDCAPVGGGALTVTNRTITAINYSTGAVTHATDTANSGDAVAMRGEYPASSSNFPVTCEGLMSLVSDTGALEGLNPATSGQENWAARVIDIAGDNISSMYIDQLCRQVKNQSGLETDLMIFPSAQCNSLVGLATVNLRFDVRLNSQLEKKALDLGFNTLSYAGRLIVEDKDARPDRIHAGNSDVMKKFEALPLALADDEAGAWTRVIGADGIADATAGLLRWYFNVGTIQRSGWGCLKGLAVPTAWQNQPPTK